MAVAAVHAVLLCLNLGWKASKVHMWLLQICCHGVMYVPSILVLSIHIAQSHLILLNNFLSSLLHNVDLQNPWSHHTCMQTML